MKISYFFSLTLLFSSAIFTNNFHNKIVVSGVNHQEPFWCFEQTLIRQKTPTSFINLLEKWNKKIEDLWKDLIAEINEDIGIDEESIDEALNSPEVIQKYISLQQQKYHELSSQLTSESSIDPFVRNFIKNKISYFNIYKPYELVLFNELPLLTTSFGSNALYHYLVCNAHIYSHENIKKIYESALIDETSYHVEPGENVHKTRCIELSNLLHLGLSEAFSGIIHQSHFLINLLTCFEFNQKSLSEELQKKAITFIQFRSFIEATLQSKNPLESAQFLKLQNNNNTEKLFHDQWQEFIKDIENCYNEEDLKRYDSFALKVKRSALLQ